MSPTIAQEANYADWLAQCATLAGKRWQEFQEQYSFRRAYDDRWTPEQAVHDCRGWLNCSPEE